MPNSKKCTNMLLTLAVVLYQLDSDAFGSRLDATNVTEANMTVVVGHSVDIPCSTDTNESVRWTYLPDQAGIDEIELYFKDHVMNGHAARFEVRRPSERNFALTIKSTLMSDSGIYECRNENGVGDTVIRTVLTVINNTGDTTLADSLSTIDVENRADLSRQTTQNMSQETSPDVTTSPSSMDLKKSQDTNVPAIVLGVVLSVVIVVIAYKYRHAILAKMRPSGNTDHQIPLMSVDARQNSGQESVRFTSCQNNQTVASNSINQLPIEMLELLLQRSFVKLYDDTYKSSHRTSTAVAVAYAKLATVCYNWMKTLKGWPQSSTKYWVKHKLRRAIESVCRPYAVFPRLVKIQPVSDVVFGLTLCGDKLVVAYMLTEKVDVFELDNLLPSKSFTVNWMSAQDIVACTETQNIYIAGHKEGNTQCVWRISPSGNVAEWLPDNLIYVHARSTLKYLSIKSRRLLVACPDTNTMVVYGPDAAELMHVSSSAIEGLLHAVETSRGTFIASHTEPKPSVTEIDDSGNVINSFDESLKLLETPIYLALDSEDRILVLDKSKGLVLLLNNDLTVERILLEKKDMGELPLRMCYAETVDRLFVGDSYCSVRAFSIRSSVQRQLTCRSSLY